VAKWLLASLLRHKASFFTHRFTRNESFVVCGVGSLSNCPSQSTALVKKRSHPAQVDTLSECGKQSDVSPSYIHCFLGRMPLKRRSTLITSDFPRLLLQQPNTAQLSLVSVYLHTIRPSDITDNGLIGKVSASIIN